MVKQLFTIRELLDDGTRLVGMYILLVVLQLLFSFVTWLVFLLLVNLVSLIPIPRLLIRLLIFSIGILLTIGTFMALDSFIGSLSDRDSLINLVYANCAGIGWGVWYYKLDIKAKEQNITAEEI